MVQTRSRMPSRSLRNSGLHLSWMVRLQARPPQVPVQASQSLATHLQGGSGVMEIGQYDQPGGRDAEGTSASRWLQKMEEWMAKPLCSPSGPLQHEPQGWAWQGGQSVLRAPCSWLPGALLTKCNPKMGWCWTKKVWVSLVRIFSGIKMILQKKETVSQCFKFCRGDSHTTSILAWHWIWLNKQKKEELLQLHQIRPIGSSFCFDACLCMI